MGGTAGVLGGEYATFANNEFAIRPAMYVKTEAVAQDTVGTPGEHPHPIRGLQPSRPERRVPARKDQHQLQ